MKTHYRRATMVIFAILVVPTLDLTNTDGKQTSDGGSKPIVAFVSRPGGHFTIKIEPNPAPGKDPLYGFNALHDKLGSKYPVVAIVDVTAKISDLYQVPGIAAKAGFEAVRTFIYNRDNGMMMEVKFGPALPFSMSGPFDLGADAIRHK